MWVTSVGLGCGEDHGQGEVNKSAFTFGFRGVGAANITKTKN